MILDKILYLFCRLFTRVWNIRFDDGNYEYGLMLMTVKGNLVCVGVKFICFWKFMAAYSLCVSACLGLVVAENVQFWYEIRLCVW